MRKYNKQRKAKQLTSMTFNEVETIDKHYRNDQITKGKNNEC